LERGRAESPVRGRGDPHAAACEQRLPGDGNLRLGLRSAGPRLLPHRRPQRHSGRHIAHSGGSGRLVEVERRRVGLFVDELLGQQQVVIKSLENNFRKAEGFSGATILGDGTVSLILDAVGLIRNYLEKSDKPVSTDRAAA